MSTQKGILLQRITNKSPWSCVIPDAMITTSNGYTTLTTTTVPFVNITATGNTVLGDSASTDTLTINANTTSTGTITVGVDDTGKDVKLFGATSGAYALWDESEDTLTLAGGAKLSVDGTSTLTGLATFTGGILSNDDITLGAGDNLVGSSTSDILINTDKFTVAGATGNTVVAGTLGVTGLATLTAGIDGKVILAGTETIAAGGTTTALNLAKTCHYIDADADGDIFTLANGVEGQIMVIVCKSATGVATITPATMKGGTSVTLNAAGDTVMLAYVGAGWSIIGGNGYTVVS